MHGGAGGGVGGPLPGEPKDPWEVNINHFLFLLSEDKTDWIGMNKSRIICTGW